MFILDQRWCSLQDSGDLSGKCHWSLGLFSRRILAVGLGVREIKLSTEQKTFGLGHQGSVQILTPKPSR